MENNEIIINKVTCKGKSITVTYNKLNNGRITSYIVSSGEEARPELYKAFKALSADVAVMMSLTEVADITSRLIPYGLIIHHKPDDTKGIKFLCRIVFPELKAESNIMSPQMTECTADNKGKEGRYLTEATTQKVYELLHEVNLYIEGKRAQMSLWDDEDGTDQDVPSVAVAETKVAGRIAAAAPSAKKISFN